jgi:phosphatidylglycerophosphatase A
MPAADRLRFLLATCGGLGLAPFAPGTFGSLGGIALAAAAGWLLDPPGYQVALWSAALLLFAAGCALSGFVQRCMPAADPGCFVLDEVVGMLATLALFAVVHGEPSPLVAAAGFGLFRLFDIAKLPPVNQLEAVPGATGVMLDDVGAALQAALLLVLLPYLGVA